MHGQVAEGWFAYARGMHDDPGAAGNPALARLRLGSALKALRTAAGITGDQAGAVIGASQSKMSRLESGQIPAAEAEVAALLRLYRAGRADRAELRGLARASAGPGWWDGYADLLPAGTRYPLSLEAAATEIRIYDSQAVPALLQTAGYARLLCAGRRPDDTWRGGLGQRVLARRRELLAAGVPCRMWVLLAEGTLRRAPGGDPEVLAEQIGHLASLAGQRRIAFQVVPDEPPASLYAPGPFEFVRFASPGLPDVVLLESFTGITAVSRTTEYLHAFNQLAVAARQPGDSQQLLHDLASGRQPGPQPAGTGEDPPRD
jgi:transcriptional regulator with XRE-family HTH domain